MAKRITVVVSQGQSANPIKRKLEEKLVAALMFAEGLDVTVVPHLYDLTPDGTGMLCLEDITGDVIVLSWLYPRAAFWTLDRNGIRGQFGVTLLAVDDSSDEDGDTEGDGEEELGAEADDKTRVTDSRPMPRRKIYCVDLRACDSARPFVEEVERIAKESSTETVELMSWIDGTPKQSQLDRYLDPSSGNGNGNGNGNGGIHGKGHGKTNDGMIGIPLVNDSLADPPPPTGGPIKIDERPDRRWYPIIDFSRCTNCMECIDFCLFGVYGVDGVETILVEQPDNCRKGCPACSRVCPENAIIFPQHKTPTIAGSPEVAGSLKIDLSQLFGAPSAVDLAAAERDEQLVIAGRDEVGMSASIPKRQQRQPQRPKDDLDDLIDAADELEL